MKAGFLLFCTVLFSSYVLPAHAEQSPPIDEQQIIRGQYIATLGDCTACHTAPDGGKPFAGGYGIASPLGTIYSSNITPSTSHGIGRYTLAEFTKVLREGVTANGTHLYPAMPYPAYTKLNDQDIADLYAYFMHGVEPVDASPAQKTDLPFPYNMRWLMSIWNAMFVDTNPVPYEPEKGELWNRGAYLVSSLTHCSTCHTPRNTLMAEEKSQFLSGSALGSWYAPNITADPNSGIGNWSADDLFAYLKSGQVDYKAQAAGPMAEAVEHSFQYVKDDDLRAIVSYIKTVTPITNLNAAQPRDTYGKAFDVDAEVRGEFPVDTADGLVSGATLYSAYCASCHQATGSGTPNQAYPALFENSATGLENPSNLISAILNGVDKTVAGRQIYMPHFSENSPIAALTNQQISEISNFVLNHYGNPSVTVTAEDIAEARKGGKPPFLLVIQPYIVPAIVVILLLLILVIYRKSRKYK